MNTDVAAAEIHKLAELLKEAEGAAGSDVPLGLYFKDAMTVYQNQRIANALETVAFELAELRIVVINK